MRSGASFRVRRRVATRSRFTPEPLSLAARAPVGGPGAEALLGERDRRAAAPAGPAAAPVDPQAFARRQPAGRPPAVAALRAAPTLAASWRRAMSTSAARRSSDERRHRRERLDAAFEQHLRLEDVADAGQRALVEQRFGDRHRSPRACRRRTASAASKSGASRSGPSAADRVARADVAGRARTRRSGTLKPTATKSRGARRARACRAAGAASARRAGRCASCRCMPHVRAQRRGRRRSASPGACRAPRRPRRCGR